MNISGLFKTAVIIVLIPLTLSCSGKEEQAEDMDAQEEEMIFVSSDFINVRDSVQWLRYISQTPDDTTRAYIMMGAVYLKNELPKQALWYFNIALHRDQLRPIIRLNLAAAFNMAEMYDSAEVQFREFSDLDPTNPFDEEAFRIVEKYRNMRIEPYIPERYKNGVKSFDGVSDSTAAGL